MPPNLQTDNLRKGAPVKKPLIIALILVIAIIVFGPYVTGKIAESEAKKVAAQSQQTGSAIGLININKYDRGFRSAKTEYSITPPAFWGTILQIQEPINLSCDVDHGITSVDYLCNLTGNQKYSDFVNAKLNGKDPFSINGSISAFGEITQNYVLEAMNGLVVDDQTINTPRAFFTIITDKAGKDLELRARSDAFNFKDDKEHVEISELKLDADLSAVGYMTYTGPFSLSLDTFKLKSDAADIAMTGLSMKSKSVESDNVYDTSMNIDIESIGLANMAINNVKDINLTSEINGMNTQAFIEYQTFSMEMQKAIMASAGSSDEPQVDPTAMLKAIPIIEKMLQKDLAINFGFNAKIDGEENEFQLKTRLNDKLTFGEMTLFAVSPEEAFKKLNVSLDTSIANSLVSLNPMTAALIPQSPLIQSDGKHYSLNLSLGDSFELNGEPVEFQELQGMIFQSFNPQ